MLPVNLNASKDIEVSVNILLALSLNIRAILNCFAKVNSHIILNDEMRNTKNEHETIDL